MVYRSVSAGFRVSSNNQETTRLTCPAWRLHVNEHQSRQILPPALNVVSGDLIYDVRPDIPHADAELTRQYDQTVEFLVGLVTSFSTAIATI
jgi:hypothetical protein